LAVVAAFRASADDAAEHADPAEVHREFRGEIERARNPRVTPMFLATHDDVVARHLALFDVFLDVAEEYELPVSPRLQLRRHRPRRHGAGHPTRPPRSRLNAQLAFAPGDGDFALLCSTPYPRA
jgi:hypothetical protein